MTWFRVDDNLHSHRKTIEAGNAAMGLWVRCGSYCSAYLTDGFIAATVARQYGRKAEIEALVRVGYWVAVEGGYQMHDYHDRNPTAEKVNAERDAATERQRRAREAATSRRDKTVTHAVTNGDVTVPPTRPDPTRTPMSKSPPPPKDSRGEPSAGGGGGLDCRYQTAIERAVDIEQARERNPIANTHRWRATVRARIETEHGAELVRLLATDENPDRVAERLMGIPEPSPRPPAGPTELERHVRAKTTRLLSEGTPPDAIWTELTTDYPHEADAIADVLLERSEWTRPTEHDATVTQLHPTA